MTLRGIDAPERDDRVRGGRLGFAAHQAMGYFEDAEGNDRYDTRQGVAQGLSWDETVVTFIGGKGQHGIVCDLPGGLDIEAAKKLIKR